MSLTASQARAELFPLIAQVNEDAKPLHITSKAGNAVLVGESEWESILETLLLFTNPINAKRLLEGLEQANSGKGKRYEIAEIENLILGKSVKKSSKVKSKKSGKASR